MQGAYIEKYMMSTFQDQQNEAQRIYLNGMAALAKLIEIRIENDIRQSEEQLSSEEAKQPVGRGVISTASTTLIEKKRRKLREQVEGKQRWFRLWHAKVWEGVAAGQGNVVYLQQKPLANCMASYTKGQHGEYERFSLLQEAILAPVYGEFENMPRGLTELNPREQAQLVARNAGFAPELGAVVYDDTEAFIKTVQNFWPKVTQAGLVSGLAMATVAVIAAPAIAGVIGGLFGLHGAAAMSFGLALLGGGPLAAGGLGMAGGVAVLGTSGGLLGIASGGGSTASFLARLPKESIALSMAKIVNYVKYLNSVPPNEMARATAIRSSVLAAFLEMKHEFEREVVMDGVPAEDASETSEKIRIFHVAYTRMVDVQARAIR